MMPFEVFRPIFTFLKKFSQNSASVQDGMIYGKVKTAEMNLMYFRFVRVTIKATAPPKAIAIRDAARETVNVFRKGA